MGDLGHTLLAALLTVVFRGSANALVSLFALGVSSGVSLSQAGMVVHRLRVRSAGLRRRAVILLWLFRAVRRLDVTPARPVA